MNIGIDIDGVLTNLEEYIKIYGSKYAVENNLGFDLEMGKDSVYGFKSKEDSNNFWEKNWFDYAYNVPVRPFAAEIIKKLKEKGNNIIIITARTYDKPIVKYGIENQKRMEKAIIKWLKNNNIEYDKIIFSGLSKIESCLENHIDIMIEDSTYNIEQLKKITKVMCFDAKYNSLYKDNNITRIYNWNDIYKIIIKD